MSDRRIHSNAVIVAEDLTNKVVAWATEIACYAAQFRQDRRAATQHGLMWHGAVIFNETQVKPSQDQSWLGMLRSRQRSATFRGDSTAKRRVVDM